MIDGNIIGSYTIPLNKSLKVKQNALLSGIILITNPWAKNN